MARSRLADLRDDAAELASLIAGLNEPLPQLTSVSMLKLYRLLQTERERSRRILALTLGCND